MMMPYSHRKPRRKVVWALVGRDPVVFEFTLFAWRLGGYRLDVEPILLDRELSARDISAGFYLGTEIVVSREAAELIPPGGVRWVPGLVDEGDD